MWPRWLLQSYMLQHKQMALFIIDEKLFGWNYQRLILQHFSLSYLLYLTKQYPYIYFIIAMQWTIGFAQIMLIT